MLLTLALLVIVVMGYSTALRPHSARRVCSSSTLLAKSKEIDSIKDIEGNCVFYTRIKEYGDNRMAKRAVSVLKDMYNKGVNPTVTHYNAALWACEKSDLFNLATEVHDDMTAEGVPLSAHAYEALTSVAEKTGHWMEALTYLQDMEGQSIKPNTAIFNHCMWAAERGGQHRLAIDLLARMEAESVERNEVSYSACIYACEAASDGTAALHVLDLMKAEQHWPNSATYKAAMWACVKAGMWNNTLSLFEEMEVHKVHLSEEVFHAAIWACEVGCRDGFKLADRGVAMLKAMKAMKLERRTIAYDGALSALATEGRWEEALDMLSWMDREPVSTNCHKSPVTYRAVIDALDAVPGQEALLQEVYQRALRDGYFIPWEEGSRFINLCDFTVPCAKAAMRSVLSSIVKGKVSIFDLNIAVSSVDEDWQVRAARMEALKTFFVQQEPQGVLRADLSPDLVRVDQADILLLHRDVIASWISYAP